MNIRAANPFEFDRIWSLIQEVIVHMHTQGLDHWDREYPLKDMIETDLKAGTLYIMEDLSDRHENDKECKLVAIITVDQNPPPEYAGVDWLTSGGTHLIVHRLAIIPEWQGQGIAGEMMNYAEELAIKMECASIRLDTYCRNMPGKRLYKKRGYIRTGEVFFPGYSLPFYCFEKVF